jgi:hypothetical protein
MTFNFYLTGVGMKYRTGVKCSPREIFTPLNSKTVQLGHDSDSRADLTGACPVKFFEKDSRADLTGACPVKFFEKDSRADLTGVHSPLEGFTPFP